MHTNLVGIWPWRRAEEMQCLAAGRTNESVGKGIFPNHMVLDGIFFLITESWNKDILAFFRTDKCLNIFLWLRYLLSIMMLWKQLISVSYQIKHMTAIPLFYNVYAKVIEKNKYISAV